ncbi:Putative phage protein [Nitrosotalea sinensis]|jgi:membrane protease subunit (stomatin/prohibitin family)|uniref:Phage protein n=1 Tax=Nitrosotalea sinensis TaxID=1499975 RepID=A0A2H1EHG5_9ARCH|nr:SPFH domain-containing protein [Candidatus Nitrosotalea sinensis]SHO45657.1 Putative phage protein [Candidatus Nitrosotalea sinensis]
MFGHKKDQFDGGSVAGSTTIEWDTQYKQGNIMWKVPRLIRLNDNIVVREDEIAVFFRDGKVLTYFDKPNRYALTDFNAPIVGGLLKFFTGVQQAAEVYYLQNRYIDGKFGSQGPYQFVDPVFGIVNLRVFGEFRWKVSSPENFINQFVGTFAVQTSDEIETRLKEQLVILLFNALGKMKESGMKITDIATNLQNIEQIVLSNTATSFGQYGVEINKISGLTISLPDEVQKAINTRSEMSVLGVNYMQYQAGQAMTEAAKNPSGGAGSLAGLGVGFGAGSGIGYAMAGQMGQGMYQPPMKQCQKCGMMMPVSNNFCPSCGESQQQVQQKPQGITCPKCNSTVAVGSKFCSHCGSEIKSG